MPIPTDTYWNIKRLNIWFAASGVILMAVLGWATMQDFNQAWREPQRHGKVWEAAFVDEKIERDLTPEKEAEIARLKEERKPLEPKFGAGNPEVQKRTATIRQLESDQSNMEFAYNTLKAGVGVTESQLQDAITANDKERITQLRQKLEKPKAQLMQDDEALSAKKAAVIQAKKDLAEFTAPLDNVDKQIKKLEADVVALKKKEKALVPQGLLANFSNLIRETPLMQFINPATKPRFVVLKDVLTSLGGVKEVEATDRCMTCHVNIDNKDFAENNLLAYLEEQIASSREYRLAPAPTGKASDPLATRSKPGAAAVPEFWHMWAATATPDLVKRPASLGRISTLAKTVGAPAKVTVDGKPLASFNYVPDAAKKEDAASAALDQRTRDLVVAELLRAWIGYGSKQKPSTGRVKVILPDNLDEKTLAVPRIAAMKHVEDLKPAVITSLPPDKLRLLNDRYRRTMIAEANIARRKKGLKPLDPSPVMLAHSRLDLYVDVDSKHSMESVGCTSCHDGSGLETHFVLTAHTPRPIWVDQKTGEAVLPVQIDPKTAPKSHHGEDLSSMLAAVYPHDATVPQNASNIHLATDEQSEEHPTTRPAAENLPIGEPVKAAHETHDAPARVSDEAPIDTPPVTYVDPVTGTTGKAVSQMGYWKRTYEPGAPRGFDLVYHEWDWPMRPPKYIQANCVRCHTDVNDIKTEAPQVFEGRSLFINMGCVNCHQMDSVPVESAPKDPTDVRLIVANGQRKVGTDLRKITAKLSPAYINTWIWAPKAFRPSTKMPHFFMLENNSSDEEIRRTRQEARAITEYLVRTANKYVQLGPNGQPIMDKAGQPLAGPLQPLQVIPTGLKGSPAAGKTIFTSIGCQGCHTNLNDDTGTKRNGKQVTLAEQWIVTDLTKSGKLALQVAGVDGKPADAKAISARATEMYDGMTYNERQLYVTENLAPQYTGIVQKYPDGTPKPQFQHHGPELSGIGTKLAAGRTPEQAKAWLFDWVQSPRHYSEYTVMPQLRLNPQQAIDLTEYLLAQKRTNDKPDDPWKADLTEPDTGKLIEMTGLFLRSRFSAKVAETRADDDQELTDLATDALTTAQTPTAEAKTLAKGLSKDEKRMVFLGKKLISHYGCMSCHAINGAENLSSPCANLSDWGQKGIDKLDFGYLDHHKVESLPPTHTLSMVNGVSEKAALLTSPEYRANFADGKIAAPVEVAWPHVDHSRPSWLTQKLKNTRVYDRGKVLLEPTSGDPGKPYDKLKMPTFYLSDREVDSIVTWVISNREKLIRPPLLSKANNEQAARIARGRQLVQKYNCVGCHAIDGNGPSVQQFYKGEELTTKAPPSLRGEGNKIQHTWLFNFLKNVEPLRPLLTNGIRMPSFPILDEESTAIAAYFSAESAREAAKLKKDLEIVQKYVQTQRETALKLDIPATKTPTTLPAEMAKMFVLALDRKAGALIADKQLKPAAELLTQADAIATSQKLTEQSGAATRPVSTRLKDSIKDLNDGKIPVGIAWPGDDWFLRPEFATAAASLRKWAMDQSLLRDLQLDPTKNKPEEIARTHRTLLFQSEFVRQLYDAPYPFVDTPRPDVADAEFKKGESLFYEMQCLKCHVLGDGSVNGAQKNPTAPNLTLAHRRLQRRWVRNWVQEPAIIQIGTSMPPFFTGMSIFDVHGQVWPRSQGGSAEEVQRVEKLYGDTVEAQTSLLLNFLYAAGVRGYTGIQPTAGVAAPTPVVQERNPAAGVKPTLPPTATQPLRPGDPTRGTEAEPPGAPSPKSPQDSKTPPGEPAGVPTPKGAPVQAPMKDAKPQSTTPKLEAPKEEPKTESKPIAKPAPSGAGRSVSITGTILLEGKPPEPAPIKLTPECDAKHPDGLTEETIVVSDKNQLRDVIVSITAGLPQSDFPVPSEPAILNQTACMYDPHVLPVMVGQKILIKNSDDFLHNVHALSMENPPFNMAQPKIDNNPGRSVDPLKTPERFRIKCDVHPWMSAWMIGFEHPYFAASAADGSFAIKSLPPGEYTLTAWHEQLGTKEIPVKVEAGKPAEVQIKFAAP
jgi:mono/diheme cytochrome c family protein/plastocyanin